MDDVKPAEKTADRDAFLMGKLALGTAQFGMDYGIKNTRGRVPKKEAFNILTLARSSGIDTIDTACSYGASESVIGEYIREHDGGFELITKYSSAGNSGVKDAFQNSLIALRSNKIYGYLVHNFGDYVATPSLWDEMISLKDSGAVNKIGFSLYSPSELEEIFERGISPDLIQVPYNIFDQRFSGIITAAKDKGIEVHSRSAFLQGLLLLPPDKLSSSFDPVREKIEKLRDISKMSDLSPQALCLNFAVLNKHVDKVVIGVDGINDLKENISASSLSNRVMKVLGELTELREDNEDIILPTRWKQ